MLADIKRELCQQLGILVGVAQRATFVVDPDNIIRFLAVTDLSVGRNTDEVLRALDALQTDELCPCNWKLEKRPSPFDLHLMLVSPITQMPFGFTEGAGSSLPALSFYRTLRTSTSFWKLFPRMRAI
jgi:hypothetical protein